MLTLLFTVSLLNQTTDTNENYTGNQNIIKNLIKFSLILSEIDFRNLTIETFNEIRILIWNKLNISYEYNGNQSKTLDTIEQLCDFWTTVNNLFQVPLLISEFCLPKNPFVTMFDPSWINKDYIIIVAVCMAFLMFLMALAACCMYLKTPRQSTI